MFIDLFSGVTPEIVRPSEQLVTTAVLASTVYRVVAVLTKGSLSFFPVTLIAVTIAFVFRVFAVREHWRSIVPDNTPAACPVARARTPCQKDRRCALRSVAVGVLMYELLKRAHLMRIREELTYEPC